MKSRGDELETVRTGQKWAVKGEHRSEVEGREGSGSRRILSLFQDENLSTRLHRA